MSTTIITTLDDPRGIVWVQGDPAEVIERILDEAHAALGDEEFAGLLVAVRAAIAPLAGPVAAGSAGPVAAGSASPYPGRMRAAVRRYLTPVRVAAALGAVTALPGDGGAPAVHARIDAYVEEVAARPRGAAVMRQPL